MRGGGLSISLPVPGAEGGREGVPPAFFFWVCKGNKKKISL